MTYALPTFPDGLPQQLDDRGSDTWCSRHGRIPWACDGICGACESPPLQKGARMLKKILTVQPGTCVPLQVDAAVKVHGVTWLRVLGGFGGRFDREDWIADLPAVSISVSDYHWNGDDFGPNYGTFENACREQLRAGLPWVKSERDKLQAALDKADEALALLEEAVR